MDDISIDGILPSIQLDKNGKAPLYQQLAASFRVLAEKDRLQPHQKLPPIRKLAEALGVNAVTIVNAYKLLESGGIVYSTVGSGTYIAENNHTKPAEKVILNDNPQMHPETYENIAATINFARSAVPTEFFPADAFKTFINQVLEQDPGAAFGYGEIQGYEALRHAFCCCAKSVGIDVAAENIHVTSGVQQSVDILSKALLSPGDTVLIESPAAYGAAGAFLYRGAVVLPVPLENDGLDISCFKTLIKEHRPKLVYLTPYFQTPTGIQTSVAKKKIILSLAEQYDFYIVEEDTQSEFCFSGDTVQPLKSMDDKNKVVYIKGISKTLMPGLRIGWMILPETVREKVLSAKYGTDIETSGLIQRAFHLFLESGAWIKHVSDLQAVFYSRHLQMSS
ncbi:MAG: PLP-dependent aminotransferase family protein, partial [Clostridiales bacterium]|nr:PLP-dependent aminotransferase family protein [Clostridiales bacterium]